MLKSIFFFGLFNLFIHLQFHYYNVSFMFKKSEIVFVTFNLF